MRVVVHCAAEPAEATMLALEQERLHHRRNDPPHRPPPLELDLELIACVGVHDYGDSLARLWDEGETFITLEHDVAPWPGALTGLWNCPESWCALPLIVHAAVNETNLGCVKFSAEFIAAHPTLWRAYPRNTIFNWRSLDGWLYQTLAPVRPDMHWPPALHLNRAHVDVQEGTMPTKITGSRVMPGDIGKYGSSQTAKTPAKQTVKDLRRPGQGG